MGVVVLMFGFGSSLPSKIQKHKLIESNNSNNSSCQGKGGWKICTVLAKRKDAPAV